MTRALVLGGGGLAGIAWEAGVLLGLQQGGQRIDDWDQVIGTSAGSIVGAHVLGDPDFGSFVEKQLVEAGPADDIPIRTMGGRVAVSALRLGRRRGLGWLPAAWVVLFGLETLVRQRARRQRAARTAPAAAIRRFGGPDARLARLGSYGRAARVASEATFLAIVAEFLDPVTDWPDGLTVTAIDTDTGETVAFDRSSGVPFLSAVAASCAVPAFMPMVTIGGRRYMDGGMASQTHAQLAIDNDEAVVVAPLDLGALQGEVAGLAASRTRTTIVTPGPEAQRVIGRSVALLDPARRARAAQAGLLDGRRVAERRAPEIERRQPRPGLAPSEG